MSEYDSILKEKKKDKEPELEIEQKKSFPCFKLDVFLISIVLCVSYFMYYRTILAPEKIFMEDISKIILEYKDIFQYAKLDNFWDDDYHIVGTLRLGEEEYSYGMIQNGDIRKIDFSGSDASLQYYLEANNSYVQLSSLGDNYIQLEETDIIYLLQNVVKHFSEVVTSDRYIKNFYVDGTVPVVEANLALKSADIQNILKLANWEEDVEVLFTFKNHALTNEIISMKMSIQYLNRNQRSVITYENGEITYSDGEQLNLKFVLQRNQDDFTLKIYRSEVLYSVLSGIKKEDTYQYMYQVIDEIYNVTLAVFEEDGNVIYQMTSNIEKEDTVIKDESELVMKREESILLEKPDFSTVKVYSTFTEEEKTTYDQAFEQVVGYLREFIDKYKGSVDEVDD